MRSIFGLAMTLVLAGGLFLSCLACSDDGNTTGNNGQLRHALRNENGWKLDHEKHNKNAKVFLDPVRVSRVSLLPVPSCSWSPDEWL